MAEPAELCTLDGEVVTQVQDGGKYVAVEGGRGFRRVAYCATNSVTARRRRHTTLTLPTVTRRWTKQQVTHPSSIPPPPIPTTRPQPPPVDPISTLTVPQLRRPRPMAGRKNKAARERALLENRADSVFGGSPVMQNHTHMPSPPPSAKPTKPLFPLATNQRRLGKDDTIPNGEREHDGYYITHGDNSGTLDSGFIPTVTVGDMEESNTNTNEGGSVHGGTETLRTDNEEGASGLVESQSEEAKSMSPVAKSLPGRQDAVERESATSAEERAVQCVLNEGERGTHYEGDRGTHFVPTEEERGTHYEGTHGVRIEEEGEAHYKGERGTHPEGERGTHPEGERGTHILPSDLPGGLGEEEEGEKMEEHQERWDETNERPGSEGREGGGSEFEGEGIATKVKSQVDMDAIPEEEEADQTDTEEVLEEEEGVTERSKVKEGEEEVEMKILPEDVELESQPLQTSVDLTMNRKQVLASTNEGGSDDLPPESDPAASTDVGHTETESEGVGSVSGDGGGGEEGGEQGMSVGSEETAGDGGEGETMREEGEEGEEDGSEGVNRGEGGGEVVGVGGKGEEGEYGGEGGRVEGGRDEGEGEGMEGREGVEVRKEGEREREAAQPEVVHLPEQPDVDLREEQGHTTDNGQSSPPSPLPHQATPPPSSEHVFVVEDPLQ